MLAMSDLIPWIDPEDAINNKLTDDDVFFAFTQSINSKWELEAKNNSFVNERIRVLTSSKPNTLRS